MDKRADTNARKHVRVIIVGAGPAGIGTAIHLAHKGVHPVLLIDRAEQVGGIPALCRKKPGAVPTFVSQAHARIVAGEEFAAHLEARLATGRMAALGFMSEVRRTTNDWARANRGRPIWPDQPDTNPDADHD